jgi:ATP-dependent DNA helicase RecG
MPQAGLLATNTHANGKQETKDFEGPLVLIPQQVEDWLRNKLPQTIDRGSMRRRESPDVPFEVIREAIVNALIHRDYDIQGAKCQLLVTPDTITIKSPGRPVSPITLEQLQAFEAPMRSRNPYLHYVFSKLGYAEERGLGLASIGSRARESGLPVPKYRWKDPYLELTLFRTAKSASTQLSPALLAKMTKAEIDGWNWLSTKSRAKSIEYAKAQRVDDRTARRHLNRFVDLGLASKSGAARSTMFAVR